MMGKKPSLFMGAKILEVTDERLILKLPREREERWIPGLGRADCALNHARPHFVAPIRGSAHRRPRLPRTPGVSVGMFCAVWVPRRRARVARAPGNPLPSLDSVIAGLILGAALLVPDVLLSAHHMRRFFIGPLNRKAEEMMSLCQED